MTFEDIAVNFTLVVSALLDPSQMKLNKDVKLESSRSLTAIGKCITITLLGPSESKCNLGISAVGWIGIWKRNILVNIAAGKMALYQECIWNLLIFL